MTDYEEAIYDYILKNPGLTVNKICTEMDGKISPLTVRRKVKKLLKDGVIEDRKIGNSFHKLHISDQTQFNRINKELDNIDTFLTLMIEPLRKVERLKQQRDQGGHLIAGMYMQRLVGPYFETMFTMLWKLLQLSTEDPQISKPDSLKLHKKIIDLIAKTTKQPFHELDHKKILFYNRNILKEYKDRLSDPGTDKSVANVALVSDLLRRIDKFDLDFLKS